MNDPLSRCVNARGSFISQRHFGPCLNCVWTVYIRGTTYTDSVDGNVTDVTLINKIHARNLAVRLEEFLGKLFGRKIFVH